jgi:AbrB family looped-hinge helix DNA binding protein
MATVTSKGQVTLPKEIRDRLGLGPGSQVRFDVEDGRVILRKQAPEQALERWYGYLKGKLHTDRTDDLMAELRGEE